MPLNFFHAQAQFKASLKHLEDNLLHGSHSVEIPQMRKLSQPQDGD